MRIRKAAFGPLFHARGGFVPVHFSVNYRFVIPPALPAVLRFRALWERHDSGLIRIRRKSAFSRSGIVAGGLADLRGERKPPGGAKSRQRPPLHRVTTNRIRPLTSANSPRFQAVSEAVSGLLFPFVASGVATVETQCVAIRCTEWLQVALEFCPRLIPTQSSHCPFSCSQQGR